MTPEEAIVFITKTIGAVGIKIITYLILLILFACVMFTIYWFFVLRKKKRVDALKELRDDYLKKSRLEKETSYPYMRKLHRLPADLNKNYSPEEKKKIIQNLPNYASIYIGEVTGFKIIDLRVTPADIVRLNIKGKYNPSEQDKKDIKENIEKINEKVGTKIFLIGYEQQLDTGLMSMILGKKKEENLLVLTENQVLNYTDRIGGVILLEGFGIDRLGHFDIISGHPENFTFLLGQLKAWADADSIFAVLGDQKNLIMKGIDMNPALEEKMRLFSAMSQVTQNKNQQSK